MRVVSKGLFQRHGRGARADATLPLAALLDPDSNRAINSAVAINNHGTILVNGTENGRSTFFLLKPADDLDNDGLPDDWEQQIAQNDPNDNIHTPADIDPHADHDNDGATNLEEFLAGTDPTDGPGSEDTDGDNLPDQWERDHFGDLSEGWNDDFEGDGLRNGKELELGTLPDDPDTDGDTMPDGWEVENGLDPLDPGDADGDSDNDGATNGEEHNAESDPRDPASRPGRHGGPPRSESTPVDAEGFHWLVRGKRFSPSLPTPEGGSTIGIANTSGELTPLEWGPATSDQEFFQNASEVWQDAGMGPWVPDPGLEGWTLTEAVADPYTGSKGTYFSEFHLRLARDPGPTDSELEAAEQEKQALLADKQVLIEADPDFIDNPEYHEIRSKIAAAQSVIDSAPPLPEYERAYYVVTVEGNGPDGPHQEVETEIIDIRRVSLFIPAGKALSDPSEPLVLAPPVTLGRYRRTFLYRFPDGSPDDLTRHPDIHPDALLEHPWVMLPANEPERAVAVQTPHIWEGEVAASVDKPARVSLDPDGIGGAPSLTLTPGADPGEARVELAGGGRYLGTTTYPRRTLGLVYYVVGLETPEGVLWPDPAVTPTEEEITTYLDEVFGAQMNVFFEVELRTVQLDFDVPSTALDFFQPEGTTDEEDRIIHPNVGENGEFDFFDGKALSTEQTLLHAAAPEEDFDIAAFLLPVPLADRNHRPAPILFVGSEDEDVFGAGRQKGQQLTAAENQPWLREELKFLYMDGPLILRESPGVSRSWFAEEERADDPLALSLWTLAHEVGHTGELQHPLNGGALSSGRHGMKFQRFDFGFPLRTYRKDERLRLMLGTGRVTTYDPSRSRFRSVLLKPEWDVFREKWFGEGNRKYGRILE